MVTPVKVLIGSDRILAQRRFSLAAETEPGPDAASWVQARIHLYPVKELHDIQSYIQFSFCEMEQM